MVRIWRSEHCKSARFPRYAVVARASIRTEDVITGRWWVPVVTAAMSAVGAAIAAAQTSSATWGRILLAGLIVGVGTYLLVVVGTFLWNMNQYRRFRRDDAYEDRSEYFNGNLAVKLERRDDVTSPIINELGHGSCQIRCPSGRGCPDRCGISVTATGLLAMRPPPSS
jgi:hypothetical protein